MRLDPHQQSLTARLDRFQAGIKAGQPQRGMYVHGAVGRGKTWLCDQFFEQLVGTPKRRVHFHSFFRGLHRDIWSHQTQSPAAAARAVDRAVADLLDGIELLYFDEFHVHDSGDAALVLRVLDAVLASEVALLATSNHAPVELLPGPFHHVFERGIRLIEQNLEVVELGGDHDYRFDHTHQRSGFGGVWISPGTPAQLDASGLTQASASETTRMAAGGHVFTARRASAAQLWFTFAELCERDSSVADYLEWADSHDAWVLEGVPRMADTTAQAAQRFVNLVDVLCDVGVTLHVLSEHPHSAVFDGSHLPLDAARTASRLALLRSSPGVNTQP